MVHLRRGVKERDASVVQRVSWRAFLLEESNELTAPILYGLGEPDMGFHKNGQQCFGGSCRAGFPHGCSNSRGPWSLAIFGLAHNLLYLEESWEVCQTVPSTGLHSTGGVLAAVLRRGEDGPSFLLRKHIPVRLLFQRACQ